MEIITHAHQYIYENDTDIIPEDVVHLKMCKIVLDLSNYLFLEILELHECVIESLDYLNVKKLSIKECPKLTTISHMDVLKILIIYNCPSLKFLVLPELYQLSIHTCPLLESLPKLNNISYISLTDCPQLKQITGNNIRLIAIDDCVMLESISIEADIPIRCHAGRCPSLQHINIDNLSEIFICQCPLLPSDFLSLIDGIYLQKLYVNSDNLLLPDVNKFINLRYLGVHLCQMGATLDVSKLIYLEQLQATNLAIEVITDLTNFIYLDSLMLNCRSLREMPNLSGCINLTQLNLYNCSLLKSLPFFDNFANIKNLEIVECPKLIFIPKLTNMAHFSAELCPQLFNDLNIYQQRDRRNMNIHEGIIKRRGMMRAKRKLFHINCSIKGRGIWCDDFIETLNTFPSSIVL